MKSLYRRQKTLGTEELRIDETAQESLNDSAWFVERPTVTRNIDEIEF